MRIASYLHRGAASYGVLVGGGVVDLRRRIGERYPSLLALLEGGALEAARAAVRGQAADFPEREIDYLPVIPDRVNIFCTGLNYRGHIDGDRARRAEIPPPLHEARRIAGRRGAAHDPAPGLGRISISRASSWW